jgi:hypothetical protein
VLTILPRIVPPLPDRSDVAENNEGADHTRIADTEELISLMSLMTLEAKAKLRESTSIDKERQVQEHQALLTTFKTLIEFA